MTQYLPEFEAPPVSEVVLGVQFEKLESLHSPQMGVVWQEFRDRFPGTEQHAPIEPVFERFGSRTSTSHTAQFQLLSGLPSPRIWFLNDAGTELIQVQQDRFIRNWRRKHDGDEYPRYAILRKEFAQDFRQFERMIAAQGWGSIEPNQCELTYVNLLPAGTGWNQPGELANVTSLFRPQYSDSGLGIPEEASVGATYVIAGQSDEPVGRLHISINPIVRTGDGTSAIRMTLTARGVPEGTGTDGILRFLDRGHEFIVRGFASITTPEMHALWRRKK